MSRYNAYWTRANHKFHQQPIQNGANSSTKKKGEFLTQASQARMLKRGSNALLFGMFSCLHRFRSLMLNSTSVVFKDGVRNPDMVDYLVRSLGFSEEAAISVVTKVSRPLQSTEKSELVVDFLRKSGFDETHIRKVVTSYPYVLCSDVEKTLKPKFRVFQDLGFSGSDLGLLMSKHPHVLARSLKTHIVPALALLKSVIGSNEKLVRVILKIKSQRMLASNVRLNLPDNVQLLQSYGVPREKIEWFMLQRPLFLLQRTQWVGKIVKGVEEKLHIPRTSGMFLYGVAALGMKSDEKMEAWLQVFRSYGWSDTEIFESMRRHPFCLTLSEKAIKVKLQYFMKDLGYGSDYLAKHPVLLSHSLEKKVVPRATVMQVLKEQELLKFDVSMYCYLGISESKFLEKYVLPFKDKLPELYEDYTRMTSGSLSKT